MHSTVLPDIRKTVVLDAPIDKVWKAVSTADGIAAWFMPNDLKAELGHNFSLNAGEWGVQQCTVTLLQPPHCLAFDWGDQWHIRFELKDHDGKTEFTLIHSGWDSKSKEKLAQEQARRNHMSKGWDRIVERRLAEHVEVA